MIVKVLILENSPIEKGLIDDEINGIDFNYSIERIKSIDELENARNNSNPDIILSGFSLFHTSGKEALQIRNQLYPSIPFIHIADHIEVDNCIELLKQGVTDIVLKQNISSLPHKMNRALQERRDSNKDVFTKQPDKENSNNLKASKKKSLSGHI